MFIILKHTIECIGCYDSLKIRHANQLQVAIYNTRHIIPNPRIQYNEVFCDLDIFFSDANPSPSSLLLKRYSFVRAPSRPSSLGIDPDGQYERSIQNNIMWAVKRASGRPGGSVSIFDTF